MKRKIYLVILCLTLLCSCGKQKNTTEFSVSNWNMAESEQRYLMLEDLYEKEELVGFTIEEVHEILGEQDITHEAYISDAGKCDYHEGYMVRYDSWEGDEFLLINYKDGIVVSYELEYGSNL